MYHNGLITLWGHNASDQVYYISCLHSEVLALSAWSVPVPILSGIEEMSPHINRVGGGNTIFAAGGGKLQRITQDPESKLWRTNDITLPIPSRTKCMSFNSYTIMIQVSDEEGHPPPKDTSLSLSASNRCAVYINGLYYVVDRQPIHIKPDALGSITIVESTGTLSGTTFKISTGGGSAVTINPMDKSIKKLATLNTAEKLRAATIKDGGTTKPLVSSSTSSEDLKKVATALENLGKSYNAVNSSVPQLAAVAPTSTTATDLGEEILITAGDLFKWLDSGVEAVIHVVEDAASSVWHIIAEIAGKVYKAVLDTVEAVVGAVVWVFNAIKTAIEDLIKYIAFLFEWEDIKKMHTHLVKQVNDLLDLGSGGLENVEKFVKQQIEALKKKLRDAQPMDHPAANTLIKKSLSSAHNHIQTVEKSDDIQKGHHELKTHPGKNLVHHHMLHGNILSSISTVNPDVSEAMRKLINDFFDLIKDEVKAIEQSLETVSTDINESLNNGTLTVNKLIDIVGGEALQLLLDTFQNIITHALQILADLIKLGKAVLNAELDVPIFSDLYRLVAGENASLTVLDFTCLTIAIPTTVIYKLLLGRAPTDGPLFDVQKGFAVLQLDQTGSLVVNSSTADILQPSAPMKIQSGVSARKSKEDKEKVKKENLFNAEFACQVMYGVLGGGELVWNSILAGAQLGPPTGTMGLVRWIMTVTHTLKVAVSFPYVNYIKWNELNVAGQMNTIGDTVLACLPISSAIREFQFGILEQLKVPSEVLDPVEGVWGMIENHASIPLVLFDFGTAIANVAIEGKKGEEIGWATADLILTLFQNASIFTYYHLFGVGTLTPGTTPKLKAVKGALLYTGLGFSGVSILILLSRMVLGKISHHASPPR